MTKNSWDKIVANILFQYPSKVFKYFMVQCTGYMPEHTTDNADDKQLKL